MAGDIDHGSRAHALLSASGASRWLNCTPSPRLEESFEEKTSPFAEEGTLAHEFAEINLQLQLKIISKRKYNILAKPLKAHEFYSEEMEEYVQDHVDYVKQQFTAAKRKTQGAILSIEEKIDLTYYIEDGFGTNDDVIIADNVLEVIDLKYGKGVRVDAKENSQLMLYGLGALRHHELSFDIDTVRLTVTQPRLNSISTWEISVEDLKAWGETVVKPKAIEAYAGDGKQAAGDWCRFCKAKPKCKALAAFSLEAVKRDFADDLECKVEDPKLLTDDELIKIFKVGSQIKTWLESLSSYVYEEAINGKKWPEHKLVHGRSVRKWTDAEKVKTILLENKYELDKITSAPKLLGIGKIEKLVTKKKFGILLGKVVEKPEGKPTLVHETDKRQEIIDNSVEDDFGKDDPDDLS
jgi:hypothetical protein